MAYRILVPRPVQKQLDKLQGDFRIRVLKAILALKSDPRPSGCVKLKGLEDEYRIRVGKYRIRYQVDDRESIVVLLHLKDRKDAYKT